MNKNNVLTANQFPGIAYVWDPFANKNASDRLDEKLVHRNPNDPDQAPTPEEGDRIIIAASLIGIILGGVIGFLLGMYAFGQAMIFISIIVGMIAGGFIGVYTGSYLKKKRAEKDGDGSFSAGI